MPAIDKQRLSRLFADAGLILEDSTADKFCRYADLLVEWNEKINLTAITDAYGIECKHFLDSCLPFSMFAIPQGCRIIDVGTGAGFPGIPVKLMRPDIKLTLLDSLNKRLRFLSEVSASLGLYADLVHGRAEELGMTSSESGMRESFDLATARAVASLPVLCEYCLPFVKHGGYFAALKGAGAQAELEDSKRAVELLGGSLEKVCEYSLPNGDGRTLILIKKVRRTPSEYPRSKGRMNKKPLK